MEFTTKGWGNIRFDDFERQLDALAHWDALCDLVDRHQPPIIEYSEESIARRLPEFISLS